MHLNSSGGSRGAHHEDVRINRTQALVLGFSLAAWISLIVIFVAAPETFASALKLPAVPGGDWPCPVRDRRGDAVGFPQGWGLGRVRVA
jgi:hypothetical protein